jgi:hypothetical protein
VGENEMTKSLMDLKAVLYDMLTAVTQNGENANPAKVTQQLGIQMSKAVQKDGINVIQLQNIHLNTVIPHLIEGMKLIDELQLTMRRDEIIEMKQIEMKQIEMKPIEMKPEEVEELDAIDAACKFLHNQSIGWKEMQELMRTRYAMYIRTQFETYKEGADFLGLQRTYFSKILKPPKVKEEEEKKEGKNEETE